MLLVLSDKGKGMQSSSEQPIVGEERYVMTLITAAKETRELIKQEKFRQQSTSGKLTSRIYDHFLFLLLQVAWLKKKKIGIQTDEGFRGKNE